MNEIRAAWKIGRALRETSIDFAVFVRGWQAHAERVVPVSGVECVEACEVQVGDEVIVDLYHRGVVCESKEEDIQEDRPGHWLLRIEGNPPFELDRDVIVLRVVPVSSEPECGKPDGHGTPEHVTRTGGQPCVREPGHAPPCQGHSRFVAYPDERVPVRPVVEASGERVVCADCGEEVTGTDDGTGHAYCPNCDEGKDDEHVDVASGEREAAWMAYNGDPQNAFVTAMRGDFCAGWDACVASARVPDEAPGWRHEAPIPEILNRPASAVFRVADDAAQEALVERVGRAIERVLDPPVGDLEPSITQEEFERAACAAVRAGAASRVPSASGELVSVLARDLRAGDEVLLRVDQVLAADAGRVALVGVETGPFLAEQQILRARHPDGS